MPEPTSAAGAAAGYLWMKFIPAIVGFAGAVITLCYIPELSRRQWVTAILFGISSSYFVPPLVIAWLHHNEIATWVPNDGSVAGLLGLLLGMASIHIVGGLTVLGRRFARDPVGFISRKGGEK